MALRIVVDSTADLPASVRQEYGIEMVPLTVHFGPETFKDVVEMTVDQFWAKLTTSPHHPKTAQPAPGDFLEVYRRVYEAGDEILSIHVSAQLSGTVQSAQIAAQMMPEASITLVDTKEVSLGAGLLALEAARQAKAGKPVAEIAEWVRLSAAKTNIIFTCDTLEFLQKNGRVGRAQALIGGMLGIKPILAVDDDGVVTAADKVRGKSKLLPRTLELMQEKVPAGSKIRVGVLHTQALAEAERWLEEIRKVYTVTEHLIAPIGPVIASNAGPGAIGVAFVPA